MDGYFLGENEVLLKRMNFITNCANSDITGRHRIPHNSYSSDIADRT